MTVINRLRRLTGEGSLPVQPEGRTEKIGELRRRIDAVMSRRPSAPPCAPSSGPNAPMGLPNAAMALAALTDGEVIENEAGRFFAVRRTFSASCCHGNRRIGDFTQIDMPILGSLANAPSLAGFSLQDGLFLDTETTGLSGGSGTLAFMIGTGWFEGSAFTTLQIFLRDFGEERAALFFLRDLFAQKRFLVTFNGKTFDMNLLNTRLVMNRIRNGSFDLPHLDLLHISRRLFAGHRLPNCRLVTIEENLLGLVREADIPGSEIPGRYFDWLRTKNGNLLVDIFEHNRLDVISLAALASHLAGRLLPAGRFLPEGPAASGAPDDLPEVAGLLLDRGRTADAIALLEKGLAASSARAKESRRMLSLVYKRSGNWEKAVALWTRMLRDDPANVFAAVELAKWFEHHRRDHDRASALIVQVLPCCDLPQEADALGHRLKRLQARLARKS